MIELPTDQQLADEARLQQAVEDLQAQIAILEQQLPELAGEWASSQRAKLLQSEHAERWKLLPVASARSLKGATLDRLEDDSFLATGRNPGNDVYEITAPIQGAISGLLLEVMTHESLPTQSLGRGSNGNFVLTGVSVQVTAPSLEKPIDLYLQTATADFAQSGWPAQSILGDDPKPGRLGKNRKGWAIEGLKAENRVPRRVMFVSDQVLDVPPDSTITITMRHDSPFADHNVGRFRLSTTSHPPAEVALSAAGLPAKIASAINKEASERSAEDTAALTAYFRQQVPNPLKDVEAKLAQQQKKLQDLRNGYVSTMVMREGEPRDAFVLNRGEYDRPGQQVRRGVPAVFGAQTQPANRLELARWIVAPTNPLTARVWVNRMWEHFFGTGIVKTTENFGSQAEFPSHPELLDWLAVEFMQPSVMPGVSGKPATAWDMKAFQKMIVMSAAYRQSSHVTPELVARDPDNRLLARGPRFRLTGELIRDSALAASGLLVPKIGGPSTRPYMPAGVWDETSKYGNLRNYQHDEGEGLHRRTMYTIWKRTAAPPTMLLFDAPNRETCKVTRSKTNTPLQALSLLNEVTFVEAARGLATRMMTEGGETPESRIAYGFRLVVSRNPTDEEMQVLVGGLGEDMTRFADSEEAARQLIGFGDANVGNGLDPKQLAAYLLTANVLLNLDEFVTKE